MRCTRRKGVSSERAERTHTSFVGGEASGSPVACQQAGPLVWWWWWYHAVTDGKLPTAVVYCLKFPLS